MRIWKRYIQQVKWQAIGCGMWRKGWCPKWIQAQVMVVMLLREYERRHLFEDTQLIIMGRLHMYLSWVSRARFENIWLGFNLQKGDGWRNGSEWDFPGTLVKIQRGPKGRTLYKQWVHLLERWKFRRRWLNCVWYILKAEMVN